MKLAKIALSAATFAIDLPYTYRIPPELTERVLPGMRVVVPFGTANRLCEGLVLSVELLGATRGQVLRKVLWPASLPWVMASLRTALGLSLSGAIVGEYLGASRGMGWAISAAGERYDTAQVLCYVFVIVVLVIVLDCVLRGVEKWVLRWQ